MIPSDLAARLRMIAEASFFDSEPPVQGTARVREIQARLPQLLPGQQFTAHITRGLPDGTFQAIVAGRNYTLALNHAAKAGDTLELEVTRNTEKAVFARVVGVSTPGAGTADGGARSDLSATGRLISFLLTGSGSNQPLPLAGGKPLLPNPPAPGTAALAPLLRQALGQSGLFYESHQLQWLSGKLDARALFAEPQGRMSGALAQEQARQGAQAAQQNTANTAASQTAGRATAAGGGTAAASLQAQQGAEAAVRQAESAQAAQAGANRALSVPDRLVPIVHQQLDGMASQQFVVHTQAWPGQQVEWWIEDGERDGQGEGEESDARWKTTLRLHLPRLGDIEAFMQLTPAGVALRLTAEDADTVHDLDASRQELEDALAAVDVPLTGFVAERRNERE